MKRAVRRGRAAVVIACQAMLVLVLAAPPGAARTPRVTPSPSPAASSSAALVDTPRGFWYGTDSSEIAIGGQAPYAEPVIGGAYGGYLGMVGNWARWQGCGGALVWSDQNAAGAATDYATYHEGVGVGAYWFMGGPGVDPHYQGTAAEAYAWGRAQARRAVRDLARTHITYPVVFMDIELPGIAPAPDNGWNAVYASPCSGRVITPYVAPVLDRADFNGFRHYITHHTAFHPGVYSRPGIWRKIFGTGRASRIPHTDEWTYGADTSSLAHPPSGWCLPGTFTCARFFGGVTRADPQALAWQWSGGDHTRNGYGDFDQIDANHQG